MKLGRGQILILIVVGLLLFGNLPRVRRETAASIKTRTHRTGLDAPKEEKTESKPKE